MKRFECRQAEEDLIGYLKGGLSIRDRERLERHLAGCASCRKLLAEEKRLFARFSGLEKEELPPDFARETMALIREREACRAGVPAERKFNRAIPALAGAAAVVVFAVILAFSWRDFTASVLSGLRVAGFLGEKLAAWLRPGILPAAGAGGAVEKTLAAASDLFFLFCRTAVILVDGCFSLCWKTELLMLAIFAAVAAGLHFLRQRKTTSLLKVFSI